MSFTRGSVVPFTVASFQNIPKELIPVAIEKYLGRTDDPVKKKDLFLDLMGDGIFGVPSVIVARFCRGESGEGHELCQPHSLSCQHLHIDIYVGTAKGQASKANSIGPEMEHCLILVSARNQL